MNFLDFMNFLLFYFKYQADDKVGENEVEEKIGEKTLWPSG